MAGASPLLVLAVLLIAGGAGGMLAKRAGLPRVTGQILAGIALGPSVLGLFDGPDHAAEHQLDTVSQGPARITIYRWNIERKSQSPRS